MGETALQSVGKPRPGPRLAFDDVRFRARLLANDVANELFLPVEHAEWRKDEWRLPRDARRAARTRISGCRLLEADPERENLTPEREVQTDFRRLVASVRRLRADATCPPLVLSGQALRCGKEPRRLRFGLLRHERGHDETRAAHQSHTAIRRGIRRNGFRIVAPEQAFDPKTGFAGLEQWASELRLAKRRRWWPWLLPLLFATLLLLGLRNCGPVDAFFGVPIETKSLLLVVDRSSSMQQHFTALRDEAKRVLSSMRDRGTSHANVITYAQEAQSFLGAIEPLDETRLQKLMQDLDGLTTGGGTRLAAALEIAAREVKAHGQPTTLVVLTDAQDGSIAEMLAKTPEILAAFGEVKIVTHGLTPRLFGAGGDPTPKDDAERAFGELAERLGGGFGALGAEQRMKEGKP